jgi:hypothetical protein
MKTGCGYLEAPLVGGDAYSEANAGFSDIDMNYVASITATKIGSRLVFMGS